ncbi:MAG: 5,10-methylenetetrahydrofolate reductase, partial [Xanthomonadales bacterium]|nr:5,10-methylenetetrahydrofolate reductase [Xanthomonadales bacterium]
FKHIGVAAYPEGHPLISEGQLQQLLLEKQVYANYLVTQMCFAPAALIHWLQKMRKAGVTLPAWLGLPGVADRARLFKLSMRIGVGQSAKILLKQKGLLRRMMGIRPYRPDELLQGLAPHLGESGIGIPGFHLFSFNDIERTEQWRRDTLASYGAAA